MDDYCNDELCEAILCWSDDHPEFNTSFVERAYKSICEGQFLSDDDRQSLVNIIEGFKINVDSYV